MTTAETRAVLTQDGEVRITFDEAGSNTIAGSPAAIRAFDRALFEHLKPWLVKANFSDDEIEKFVPHGQGTLSMTPALRELEAKLLSRQLRHGMHPILEMCARNAKAPR